MAENPKNNEAEFRAEQSERVIEFLDRAGAYEYFQDILSDKEQAPNFEKFKDFIIRINGIARDLPISERNFDGANVGLSGFAGDVIVPKHEDKEGLLKYAYESVPKVDKNDLKYMLPAIINAVHLFNDGNGRTSRTIHLLLSDYSSEQDFLQDAKKALEKGGRFETIDINPGFVEVQTENIVLKRNGWVFKGQEVEGEKGIINPLFGVNTNEVRNFDEKNPNFEDAKRFFNLYKENGRFGMECISELLDDDEMQSLSADYNGKKMLSANNMLNALQKEEWQKMIEAFWRLKREQVQGLIDIFREPEKFETSWRGESETVRDYFIEEIERQKLG